VNTIEGESQFTRDEIAQSGTKENPDCEGMHRLGRRAAAAAGRTSCSNGMIGNPSKQNNGHSHDRSTHKTQ
jgi:hypothetical protein